MVVNYTTGIGSITQLQGYQPICFNVGTHQSAEPLAKISNFEMVVTPVAV